MGAWRGRAGSGRERGSGPDTDKGNGNGKGVRLVALGFPEKRRRPRSGAHASEASRRGGAGGRAAGHRSEKERHRRRPWREWRTYAVMRRICAQRDAPLRVAKERASGGPPCRSAPQASNDWLCHASRKPGCSALKEWLVTCACTGSAPPSSAAVSGAMSTRQSWKRNTSNAPTTSARARRWYLCPSPPPVVGVSCGRHASV